MRDPREFPGMSHVATKAAVSRTGGPVRPSSVASPRISSGLDTFWEWPFLCLGTGCRFVALQISQFAAGLQPVLRPVMNSRRGGATCVGQAGLCSGERRGAGFFRGAKCIFWDTTFRIGGAYFWTENLYWRCKNFFLGMTGRKSFWMTKIPRIIKKEEHEKRQRCF